MTDDRKKQATKHERQYFHTYVQVVRNSIDSKMFRNFYIYIEGSGEFDALANGDNSCAFFVSSVLQMFKKIDGVHGTVKNTVEAMEKAGWQLVDKPKLGDVLVWEAQEFDDGSYEHIGFCSGNKKAISTSASERVVLEHHMHFGDQRRKIQKIYRMEAW